MIAAIASFGLIFSFAHDKEECVTLTLALGAPRSILLMTAYSSSVALKLIDISTLGLLLVQICTLFAIAIMILLV